jgi:hypothetical protein
MQINDNDKVVYKKLSYEIVGLLFKTQIFLEHLNKFKDLHYARD